MVWLGANLNVGLLQQSVFHLNSVEAGKESQQMTLKIPSANQIASQMMSSKAEDVAITIDEEKQPLLSKSNDPVITIDAVHSLLISCEKYHQISPVYSDLLH